jgi:hypothetical protein
MASGLVESDMCFSSIKPDVFILKPFTAEELKQAVRSAIAVP